MHGVAGVQILEATESELPELAELREASAREQGERAIGQRGWRTRFEAYLRARRRQHELQCFVARDRSTIVGMATASFINDYRFVVFRQLRGYVNAVYVRPAYRGRGIARALTKAAIAWLAQSDCECVRLRPSAQAEPLYRSMGFVESGELELDVRNVP